LPEAIEKWELVYAVDPNYKDVKRNIKKAKTLLERLEQIKKNFTRTKDRVIAIKQTTMFPACSRSFKTLENLDTSIFFFVGDKAISIKNTQE
jgi:hypothetical protein